MPKDDITKFLEEAAQLYDQYPVNTKDYLLLCRQGIDLAKKYPESRGHIAQGIVSAGSGTLLNVILSLAPDLEYPSYGKDWEQMETLVNDAIKELSSNDPAN